MPQHETPTGEFHKLDFFFLARLESHRCPGRNIQPHTARIFAIESERVVDFEEVIMAADLNRAIPRVPYDGFRRAPADVGLNRLRFQ